MQRAHLGAELRHLGDIVDSLGVRLDVGGDGVGDPASETGPYAAWLMVQRELRRIGTGLSASEDQPLPGPDPATMGRFRRTVNRFYARADLIIALLNDHRELWPLLADAAPSEWRIAEDSQYAMARQVPREVSPNRPSFGLDAAVEPVDVDAIRAFTHVDTVMWRLDQSLLYRADGRPPDHIKREGFRPRGHTLMPVFWPSRMERPDAYVSASRSKEFVLAFALNIAEPYIYTIDTRGGIDLNASLGRHDVPVQQEVVFPGGIAWDKIVRVEKVRSDGELDEKYVRSRSEPAPVELAASDSVESEPDGQFSILHAKPESSPNVPDVAQESTEPVIGIPGVQYPGPNRPLLPADQTQVQIDERTRAPMKNAPAAVSRGEFEIELHDGQPFVRVYSVAPREQVPYPDPDLTGVRRADLADVQQNPDGERDATIFGAFRGRRLAVIVGGPLVAYKLLSATMQALSEFAPWRLTAAAPVIRSYLLPLAYAQHLSESATHEAYPGQLPKDVLAIHQNVGPNVYTLPDSRLQEFASRIVPGSLITYAAHPQSVVRKEWAGSLRHVGVLGERLGLPLPPAAALLSPQLWPWPNIDELASGDMSRLRGVAAQLTRLLVTWRQSEQEASQRKPDPLLRDQNEMSYYHRHRELVAFVGSHGLSINDTEAVRRFMEEAVAPAANQAAISWMLADDHARNQRDLDVLGKPQRHDFAQGLKPDVRKNRDSTHVGLRTDITKMWREGASPAEVLDHLIDVLDLRRKYDEITVWREGYTLYEHTQMVLGQYRRLTTNEQDRTRVLSVDTLVKAILFHDFDKDNAKRQFGAETRVGGYTHGASPEHRLSVAAVRRYHGLFASEREWNAAIAVIDADPFGYYFQGKIDADGVFAFVARVALRVTDRAGVSAAELTADDFDNMRRLFEELHQFYQADFSSYTTHSEYVSRSGVGKRGKSAFDDFLLTDEDGTLSLTEDRRHFRYSDRDGYRVRFEKLHGMFRSTGSIQRHHERMEGVRATHDRWVLDDDPVRGLGPDLIIGPGERELHRATLAVNLAMHGLGDQLQAHEAAVQHLVPASLGSAEAEREAEVAELTAVRMFVLSQPPLNAIAIPYLGEQFHRLLGHRMVDAAISAAVILAGMQRLPVHYGAAYLRTSYDWSRVAGDFAVGTRKWLGFLVASPQEDSAAAGNLEYVITSASIRKTEDLLPGTVAPVLHPPSIPLIVTSLTVGDSGARVEMRTDPRWVGARITKLWEQGKDPAAILDYLLAETPELRPHYEDVEGVEDFRDGQTRRQHVLETLERYRALVQRENAPEDDRYVPIGAMVKAILFRYLDVNDLDVFTDEREKAATIIMIGVLDRLRRDVHQYRAYGLSWPRGSVLRRAVRHAGTPAGRRRDRRRARRYLHVV